MLGGLVPSTAYVVETPEGLVLVDSGLKPRAAPLRAQMAELGLDWRRIRAIFLTHAHGDHTGGAEFLREKTGAKVYAGKGDAAVLRAGGPREAFFSTFSMPDDRPHPTTIDVELSGGEAITFGGVRFRALAAPGHTPGSVCYLMEREGLRVLFAGDVICMLLGDAKSPYQLGKPLGTYSAYLAPRYRGDAKTYLATLRDLRTLSVPDLVLPGHPNADPSPQSPRLSQRRWEALLDQGIRDMEALLGRYERDGVDFLDGEPKQLLPDLFYLGDRGGRAVYGLFAASRFFLVDAPGGPGLLDFVEARLRQLGHEPVAPTAVLLTACGPDETAGLKELAERSHALVVASSEGVSRVKELCPDGTTVVSADDLPAQGWLDVTPIPLRGRGEAPIAYEFARAGRTVLISGPIPIPIDHDSVSRMIADFSAPGREPATMREAVLGYFGSLMQLWARRPDLWLPALPANGQNANLYDREWEMVIFRNWMAIEDNLGRRR
jgi:glyoxylase-like metal-dependent hydrolase (beta-lactamase superfamily II)